MSSIESLKMPTARRWTGLKVVLVWMGMLAALGILWWVLQAGVYITAFENGTVRRLAGAWSAEFASGLWALCAATGTIAMLYMTVTWILGRKSKAAIRAIEAVVHRRVLK